MGKKRITQLLDQLQTNHQADLQNAAAIFTVAQVAVNQLHAQNESLQDTDVPTLAPSPLNQQTLKARYGSFNGCRNAAKQKGIRFKKTPTWKQLEAAFNYFEVLENLIQTYLQANPDPNFHGLSIEFKFD